MIATKKTLETLFINCSVVVASLIVALGVVVGVTFAPNTAASISAFTALTVTTVIALITGWHVFSSIRDMDD